MESYYVNNAAPDLIERLDELGRVGDLQMPLGDLRERYHGTPIAPLLELHGQAILDRARFVVNIHTA